MTQNLNPVLLKVVAEKSTNDFNFFIVTPVMGTAYSRVLPIEYVPKAKVGDLLLCVQGKTFDPELEAYHYNYEVVQHYNSSKKKFNSPLKIVNYELQNYKEILKERKESIEDSELDALDFGTTRLANYDLMLEANKTKTELVMQKDSSWNLRRTLKKSNKPNNSNIAIVKEVE